jgi:hypothetical protein
MKIEKRFAFMVLGTLGLAACGGGDTVAAGTGTVEGTGGGADETGGASSSGGSPGSGGASGSGGTATGGNTSSTGGAGSGGDPADAGPDGPRGAGGTTPDDGGAPGTGGAATDGGGAPGTGGAATDGGGAPGTGGAGQDAGPPPSPAGVVAFAYAGNASSASYSPSPSYSFNASGGAINIERSAVGVYTVDFVQLDPPMRHAQATAYDHSGYCIVSSLTTTRATVRCFDNSGVAADARFSLAGFGPERVDAGIRAYAFADKESVAQYGPNANLSFTPGSGIVATRSQPGTYALEFTGVSIANGNVQISAVGSNHHCSISSWGNSLVNTICYNELGQRADTKYLAMVLTTGANRAVGVLGYARSINSTDAQNDLTGGIMTFNATGGTIVTQRTGTGAYTMTFGGANFDAAHPQVTEWFTNGHCGVTQWGGNWVKVACFDAAGAAKDGLYSLVVVE